MMRKSLVLFSTIALAPMTFALEGRDRFLEAQRLLNQTPANIQSIRLSAPETYQFMSRFDQSDSVSYTDQTFRQVLISDFKTYIDQLKRGAYPGSVEEAFEALDSFYTYRYDNESLAPGAINGYLPFSLKAQDLDGRPAAIAEGEIYEALQEEGKQLRDKTAGIDNPLRRGELKGWNTTNIHGTDLLSLGRQGIADPVDLITAWMQVIATNSVDGDDLIVANGNLASQRVSAAYVTEDGWDLNQLLQKFLYGAVSFSQAAEDYLLLEGRPGKGLLADNLSVAKPGENFTNLEHGWDEGFGYFGAARDYLSYTPQQIATGRSKDSNQDGSISILEEKNHGLSMNAARRDLGAVSGSTNLVKGAMQAFIQGRALISSRPQGYLPYAQAEATLALGYWEQTIAATTIHYINKTEKTLGKYGTNAYLFANLAKFWSEMKGFGLAFQFHPFSSVSDSDFDRLHLLLADRPALPHQDSKELVDNYRRDLLEARQILQDSFGFKAEDVSAW